MEIRSATPADGARLREVARQSFRSSYSLSPEQIEAIIEGVFADDDLGDRLEAETNRLFVAEDDVDGTPDVVGFADVEVDGHWTLRWLHVDPDMRGQGIGTALIERIQRELSAAGGGAMRARVLQDATEGRGFCERFGLSRNGIDELVFEHEEFIEYVYTEGGEAEVPNEPSVAIPETVTVDERELSVDRSDEVPGDQAPFFGVYPTGSPDERYGFLCSNCGSTDVSADDMDRLECGNCGNLHRPDDWDAAYL